MWKRGLLVALTSALFGVGILGVQDSNPLIRGMDESFQDWLSASAPGPIRERVPITIVGMDDPQHWAALDYTLFLRAVPPKSSAVVVLESLPKPEDNAYYQAFLSAALRQPRLILPVTLSEQQGAKNGDWLEKLPVKGVWQKERRYQTIKSAPPEDLQQIVPAAAVNLPRQKPGHPLTVPAYLRLKDRAVPALTWRAVLAAWRVLPEQSKISPGRWIGLPGWKHPVEANGKIAVDTTYLPGLQKVNSGDLLLKLDATAAQTINRPESALNLDRGIILLGDISAPARLYHDAKGTMLSRVELWATAIATLCNGPRLLPLPPAQRELVILFCLPGIFVMSRLRTAMRLNLLAFCVAFYLMTALTVAQQSSVAPPLFLPVAMLLLGGLLSEGLQRLSPPQTHARP